MQFWTACLLQLLGLLLCPVHCGKTADRIRMPFDRVHNLFHRLCQKYFWKGSGGRSGGLGLCLQWSGGQVDEVSLKLMTIC